MPTSLPTRAIGVLAPALLLFCSGCCDLALYFCGPDKSHWTPISYRTPQEALETFREAVRRDNVRIICESLSSELKERWGLPGCFEAAVAWERIKERAPGTHMLGRADVTGPERLSATRVRYRLEVGGVTVDIELARLAYAGVRFAYEGDQEPRDRNLESGTIDDLVRVTQQGFDSTVELRIDQLDLPNDAEITHVVASYEWKVANLRRVPDE